MIMDIAAIREHLPHRYPFLLVDRVIDLELGESIHAYKNLSINEIYEKFLIGQRCSSDPGYAFAVIWKSDRSP